MPTANRTGSISLRTLPQPMRKESNVSKGCLASTDRSPAFLVERFRDRSRTSHFAKNPSGSKRPKAKKIGRASCRERVCQYVQIWVVAVSLTKINSHLQESTI